MNKLTVAKRITILKMLVEGSSMRSIERTVGVSINTVKKLLIEAGQVALQYHDEHVVDVPAAVIQCDEIWSFCHAKRNNVDTSKAAPEYAGDVWTWTGIDEDSRLLITYEVGGRSLGTALSFMRDLRKRVTGDPQINTDGLPAYPEAIRCVFGDGLHQGGSDTAYVERHNLSMRMGMRRYTRRTNGFSKRLDRHVFHLAFHSFTYNFIRVHQTLQTTPAVAAGIAKRPMDMPEVVEMIDQLSN